MEKLESFVEACTSEKKLEDAVIAQDLQQVQNIWKIRDGLAEAVVKHGAGSSLSCLLLHSQSADTALVL
jgi:hypothetical protein